MDIINRRRTKKTISKKRQMKKTTNKENPSKEKNTNDPFPKFDFAVKSPVVPQTEDIVNMNVIDDHRHPNNSSVSTTTSTTVDHSVKSSAQPRKKDKTNSIFDVKDRRNKAQTANTDDSENSSEEKGYGRKDRKPLPLIFNQSCSTSMHIENNDSSEDTCKDHGSCNKCVYLGERETLRSFWDKCLYQCFKSKRCVAGEKPKRKYRKKPKTSMLQTKKRKQLDLPLSCIDTEGTAVAQKGYLSRYEMLLYMDPLADSMTTWQKKDFEMAFRMVKPTDILDIDIDTLTKENNDDSTDYTNSDTDQEEVYA